MNARTSPIEASAAAAPASPAPVSAPDPTPAPRKARPLRKALLMLSVPALLVAGVGGWWLTGAAQESTENAYLHQARISVAPTVAGRVVAVNVHELQPVKAGDLLFQVDPQPYELAVAQAQAAVNAARLQVEQLKAALAQAEAQAALAADDATYQADELARQQALSGKGVTSTSALDETRHASQQAREKAEVAKLTADAARAALGGDPAAATDDHPAVRAAMAELDRANYNLSVTRVTAPADGVIYQAASFHEGVMLAAGQPVFALVETGEAWVDANFKETQLADLAPGQKAEVEFDAAPGRTFTGTVEAIGAGTGAEFSLLPAQNATGNWVKVTQRVPVRIKLDDPAGAAALASGLSADVTVDTSAAADTQLAARE
ncbi:HlyD family secretion protein [Tabrizicola sp.]|jgi:membrane fusion protein (multidrug efflux system)|uniref:HlyD family secretion protein n=1 Tax=Tabrizicola sp. TaxID=2005166 RepID=UPI001A58B16F|nr:HlyD family secretion protein [Tabrizicola sp.]MBL9061832.1 HlyD family secretion protein [Tabrizicola sp.]